MSNVYVKNLFSLFILVSLLQRIKSEANYVTEESKIASRPSLKNNFDNTQSETLITTAVTVDGEKLNDNAFTRWFRRSFQVFESIDSTDLRNINEITAPEVRLRRKQREVTNSTVINGMECLACYANSSSKIDENCYEGVSLISKKCADAEICFVEVNPQYIKRGCVLPGRLNRTFICKCPLCNDKPSFDSSHYEYKKISNWEYDNTRLQTPIAGMDLMCKVCQTKGTNPKSDKNCRYGKNADYMVCSRNQLCYTNIDDETDFVSRGCINRPLYNSIYFFCNHSECNNDKFYKPSELLRLRAEEIKLKQEILKKVKIPKKRSSSNKYTIDLYLAIILTTIKCIY